MPKINYTSAKFTRPEKEFQGDNVCTCNWADIVWAAITVGRKDLSHVFRHGQYSLFEIIFRAAMIYANLREDKSGWLSRTNASNALDPSEKSAVSFFAGVTMAKLMAGKYLNLPWLMHLDVYKKDMTPKLAKGRAKPDLVGWNSLGWTVIEAKGRTNNLSPELIEKAKEQTGKLIEVNGQAPILKVALASFFRKGNLWIHWEDPEINKRGGRILNITPMELIKDYYQQFLDLLNPNLGEISSRQYRDETFLVRPLPNVNLRVGLSVKIQDSLAENRLEDLQSLTQFYQLQSPPDSRTAIGPDGVLVELGENWDQKNMRKNPDKRS